MFLSRAVVVLLVSAGMSVALNPCGPDPSLCVSRRWALFEYLRLAHFGALDAECCYVAGHDGPHGLDDVVLVLSER